MEWIDAGLQVRFDPVFRAELVEAMEALNNSQPTSNTNAYLDDLAANMDY